jgi:Fic family protein
MSFDPTRPYNDLPLLPPPVDLESKAVLRKCISANRALASLKVAGNLIPNQAILINAIPLQEAKASSEIENIVTSGDALYRADLLPGKPADPHTKEVLHYREALYRAYSRIKEGHPITMSLLHAVCNDILRSEVQIRMFGPGKIVNKTTDETVYLAPDGKFSTRNCRTSKHLSQGTIRPTPSSGSRSSTISLKLFIPLKMAMGGRGGF